MKEEALKYLALGFSIIPVGADKRPLIKWLEYQKKRATTEQVEEWFTTWPDMNIGIITGAISGMVVVDVEKGGSIDSLPPTITARTGGQGWHLYYQHPGHDVKNGIRVADLTDIRGDGGYVIAPPSISEKGPYSWVMSFDDAEMHPYPADVIAGLSTEAAGTEKSWRELLNEDASEGTRNYNATRIVGGLLEFHPISEWESIVWPRLQSWNTERCKPVMNEKELHDVFKSIKKKEEEKAETTEKEKSQMYRLLAIVEENPAIELFRNEYEEAYARMPIGDHLETMSCRSRKFSLLLSHIYFNKHGGMPQQNALTLAINAIQGKALFQGKQYDLQRRVAQTEEALWYDLANEQGETVRITSTGWDLVSNPPNVFEKEKHMLQQVSPVRGGKVEEFLPFMNIKDDGQKLLVLVYLVSCFIPGFPHPLLYLYGQKGSSKSTLSKLMRKLIDPSIIEVVALSKDLRQTALQLLHHHFIFYENVSHIPSNVSDLLCSAITGSGYENRELYTDGGAFIFNVKRSIGINGINISAVKPDLLERTILVELHRIEDSGRRTESELYAAFEEVRPRILGAIFEAVAVAMKIRPSINLAEMPRMADFAAWGCAISEALGYTQEQFLKAYNSKIALQDQEALAASLEGQLIQSLMQGEDTWTGTATQLLKTLKRISADQNDGVASKSLPSAPNVLTKRINPLATNLLAVGIEYDQQDGGTRLITLKRMKKAAVVEGVPEGGKGGQGDVFGG